LLHRLPDQRVDAALRALEELSGSVGRAAKSDHAQRRTGYRAGWALASGSADAVRIFSSSDDGTKRGPAWDCAFPFGDDGAACHSAADKYAATDGPTNQSASQLGFSDTTDAKSDTDRTDAWQLGSAA